MMLLAGHMHVGMVELQDEFQEPNRGVGRAYENLESIPSMSLGRIF